MVGPNFRSPPAPKVEQYTESKLPAKTVSSSGAFLSNKAQRFLIGKDIPKQWWQLFHSRKINQLVEMGLKNSPTIASANAALRVAQENYRAQIGSTLLPAINYQNYAQRQLLPETTYTTANGNVPFNVFYSVFNLSYTVDVFGGARRQIESLKAQVDYQQFELLAADLTLTANIVNTAINLASYQQQIEVTQQLIKSERDLLHIIKKQYKLGGVPQNQVFVQETLLEQTRSTLPILQKNLVQTKYALATLIGTFPNVPMPAIDLDTLNLPGNLPVSLPSNLIRQRPDVRASEALLHSASALIGVAVANLLPALTITAYEGWTGNILNNFFGNTNKIWSALGQVNQPLFEGGSLFAKRRAAIAAYQQALAQYRQVVLTAFQDVANALSALEIDARALKMQKKAQLAAKRWVNSSQQLYSLGGTSSVELLNAQQQYQQSSIALTQAKATRFTDTVSLFQSLGGGWWNTTCTN
jgi:NodT family efflux transporter outer membrane factor (OMF) lipoprotein